MKISNEQISKYRQRVGELINNIKQLSFECINADTLTQGTPSEVFKTCGKKHCKCATNAGNRHGPYLVVQVVKHGTSKQFTVKKQDRHIWDQAKQYQTEMKKYLKIKELCLNLETLTRNIIEQKTEDFPK